MHKDDLIRLHHMFEAAKEAVELSAGKSKSDIQNERLLNLSLVRLLEIVGEAANHVSSECPNKYPAIPSEEKS
jgi:uncharacterized protein with HEPN domain